MATSDITLHSKCLSRNLWARLTPHHAATTMFTQVYGGLIPSSGTQSTFKCPHDCPNHVTYSCSAIGWSIICCILFSFFTLISSSIVFPPGVFPNISGKCRSGAPQKCLRWVCVNTSFFIKSGEQIFPQGAHQRQKLCACPIIRDAKCDQLVQADGTRSLQLQRYLFSLGH